MPEILAHLFPEGFSYWKLCLAFADPDQAWLASTSHTVPKSEFLMICSGSESSSKNTGMKIYPFCFQSAFLIALPVAWTMSIRLLFRINKGNRIHGRNVYTFNKAAGITHYANVNAFKFFQYVASCS